jgi:hypothetical protein
MADAGELKIPAATRPVAESIIARTDHVCRELLDDEYADLARHVVAKLARKRPSPIQSGRAPSWAGAVVYALGQVNVLSGAAAKPCLTADDLSAAFGVGKSALGNKASPAIWYIQVDGLIVDALTLPLPIQARAFELGVIPHIPALGRDGTAALLGQPDRHNA